MSALRHYISLGSLRQRLPRSFWFASMYVASAVGLKSSISLCLLWMARELSVRQYSTVALLYALQTGVGTFAGVGVIEVLVGALNEHRQPRDQERLFGIGMSLFVLTTTVIVAAAWLGTQLIGPTFRIADPATLSAIGAGAILALSMLQGQMLRFRDEHPQSLSFSLLLPGSMIVGGVAAISIHPTPGAFFVGEVVSGVGATLSLRLLGIGHWSVWTHARPVWDAMRRIPPFATIATFGWLSGYGANLMIGVLADRSEVGKFSFLFTISSGLELLSTSFNMAWTPRFYRRVYQQPAAIVERDNRRGYFGLALVLGIAGGGVLTLLPLVFRLIGGNLVVYSEMRTQVLLLFAGYVCVIPFFHCQNYYLVFGKSRELRNNVVWTGAVGTIGRLLAIWLIGPIGIYAGFTFQMVLRSLGLAFGARRHWTLSIPWPGVLIGVSLCVLGSVASRSLN